MSKLVSRTIGPRDDALNALIHADDDKFRLGGSVLIRERVGLVRPSPEHPRPLPRRTILGGTGSKFLLRSFQ